MKNKQQCVHVFVSGKVQGVFFRANTKKEAKKLGITGWVQNTKDGRVELTACGSRENIANFIVWLHKGPEIAEVTDVQVKEIALESHKTFTIL